MTRMSLGWLWRVPSVQKKILRFVTWYGELPKHGPSRLARYLASLYVKAPTMLMIGLRGTPTLWVLLGNPYNLGGLKPCGHKCSVTSSRSEDPLKRRVVFHSADCVESLTGFLYP